jgi:CBS domain-containing protein
MSMHVSSILKAKGREVATLGPADSIAAASDLLARLRIGAVVVVSDGRVEGIVSERDIVRALARYGERTGSQRLADVMTREVVTCALDDTVEHLMTVMTRRRIRHIPVVEEGRLAGIVSIGDVVKSRLEEAELETRSLRDYVMVGH